MTGLEEWELEELRAYHAGDRFAFARSCTRRSRFKRGPLDCGHVIDGSDEFCARRDEGRA